MNIQCYNFTMLRWSFLFALYVFLLCLALGAPAPDSDGRPQVPDMENGNQTSRNGTEQEPHDDEEEHHISRHAVVWPSTLGMMIFIALSGYLFYHFYSKRQMKKFREKHRNHLCFFEEAVFSSTVTGAAAPAILAFSEKECQKVKKTKEKEKLGQRILRHFSVR